MGFHLEDVVPWGRSFEEYQAMFQLGEEDLSKKILGCGDGPASFNYELTQQGGNVLSMDPLYLFSPEEIKSRITATCDVVMRQVYDNLDNFVWESFSNPEELKKQRLESMELFLEDYQSSAGRYIAGTLPSLPFADKQFNLALCSHFLFLYSKQLSQEFHINSLLELCRVAQEVRIFPLIDLNGNLSHHLKPALNELRQKGYDCRIQKTSYEFQKGGNDMIQIITKQLA